MLNFLDHLEEKLTLQYHGKLNQKIFDGDKLKPEIRSKLLEIASAWQKFAKIPDNLVHDVILTGGNAQYTFTKYSDIDLHLVIDKYKLFNNKEYVDDYLDDKKTLWSVTRNIKIHGIPVELYAQDKNDKLAAYGVYSLRQNKWLKMPLHNSKYDFSKDINLQKKADELETLVDNLIKAKAPEEDFKNLKKKIKDMRSDALLSGDEFSFNNLIFKEIRNRGVLNKMNKYLQGIRDKALSL